MARFTEAKKTHKLIVLFAAITVLLITISIGSLLYLNHSINRFSDTLYKDIYRNTDLIFRADRDLYQSSLLLQSALNPSLTGLQRSHFRQEFGSSLAETEKSINTIVRNLASMESYPSLGSSKALLGEIRKQLAQFKGPFGEWRAAAGLVLSSDWPLGDGNPGSTSSAVYSDQLNDAHRSLEQAEQLIGVYAERVVFDFHEQKSTVFALYSLLLFMLVLVIIYLVQRIVSLQSEMREDQALYQLIGETMSDFILLTDANGLILYASPSHLSALGYVPKKGQPLSAYIRESEIAWAKLKSVVQATPRMAELRIKSADGHWIWLETKVSPVRGNLSFPAQFMLVSREITQRKQHEERLHKLAFYDHLTSIPNRAHFKMYMENLLANPDDRRQTFALALLDCDRFKQLNDTLGHLAGDEFLQLLSGELQQSVKGLGQAFRIGGDEFAVILHLGSIHEALHDILDRLLQLFNKEWSVNHGSSFRTSASIGVALYPRHGRTINELLRAADLAMYRSKSHGGNEFNLYDETMNEEYPEQETSRR
ncbi:diguanylate cyclase (GGDEF)-like protein/PAS domain S-box-containing protein [Paenibacillus forsythiae]|uniref:Diguanylate cyclase (GGDEF)-like protein/PAS domain S-box-containing protein n=1 Tax=Paenibacillus forsythiae TaxID=365616 RepID=A0ABU3H2H8_9BACL|nr:diguanylate cyclase [Paenibacillus forsythiae]MDT3425034.1 diguanylate cyclase (GGDEF)-like protein/PAS domain S-box-containing protein [Paenibacillus forsythiae]